MTKCSCEMTGIEGLIQNLSTERPQKAILIVDTGRGWTVSTYGPDSWGNPGPEVYVTVHAALENVESQMVALRRQPDKMIPGVVIKDPDELARALSP